MSTAPLSAFLFASLVLALVPGPGVAFIVTRTLAEGRRVGLASVAGVALGNFANAAAAGLGLAALFELWPPSVDIVRVAGGAYLVWLGLVTLRRTPQEKPAPGTGPLRAAFIVALLNPKTTVFFAAFLAPFIDPDRSAALQSLALGAMFVAIAAVTDSAWVLASHRVARHLKGRAPIGRALAAAVFIALGLFAAWPR